MVRQRFTDEEIATIIAQYAQGDSQGRIARRFDSKSETIGRLLAQRGIPLHPPHGRVLTDEQERAFADRYAAGERLASLTAAFGVSAASARNIARRHGVAVRGIGGQRRRFTDEEIAAIREMVEQGQSQQKIAKALGDTNQIAVSRAMRAHGIIPFFRPEGGLRGANHGAWKGGRVMLHGYVAVHLPREDPFAEMANNLGYVLEHRLVMARHLGRPLYAWETVHHIDDRDKTKNDITNLQLRIGKHGKYAAYRCMDCGSTRLEPILLE